MEVTRNVILDLLPLYLAGEASEDTRRLIEERMKTDPDLSELVMKAEMGELPGDIPVPLTKEDKMEAYKEAKRLMFLKTVFFASLISGSLIVVLLIILVAIGFLGNV
jgi:hypothetical protein